MVTALTAAVGFEALPAMMDAPLHRREMRSIRKGYDSRLKGKWYDGQIQGNRIWKTLDRKAEDCGWEANRFYRVVFGAHGRGGIGWRRLQPAWKVWTIRAPATPRCMICTRS